MIYPMRHSLQNPICSSKKDQLVPTPDSLSISLSLVWNSSSRVNSSDGTSEGLLDLSQRISVGIKPWKRRRSARCESIDRSSCYAMFLINTLPLVYLSVEESYNGLQWTVPLEYCEVSCFCTLCLRLPHRRRAFDFPNVFPTVILVSS